MKKITSLILLAGFSMLAWGQQNPLSYTAENSSTGIASFNLKNINGFWHFSGSRSTEDNNNFSIFWNNGSYNRYLTILDNGNVGIGLEKPTEKLTVQGAFKVCKDDNYLIYNGLADVILKYAPRGTGGRALVHSNNNQLFINYAGDFSGGTRLGTSTFFSNTGISYINSGKVGIGTTTPSAKLDVAGNIKAHEIEVTLAAMHDLQLNGTLAANNITYTANGNTADFVFEDNYQLRDLSEVEAYIKANRHLPEIPSANEMEATGVNLAEMNKLLLMKVEELTLYSIELEKKVEKVRSSESAVRKEMEEKVEGLELKVEELSDEKRAMRGEMEELKKMVMELVNDPNQ